MRRPWMAPAASLLAYVALTAVAGWGVLQHPASRVIADLGDPLLTASILHWNASVLPLSDAWWQFPNFHPTADTLAFSEHLLGLSPVATPIEWLTRDPLVAANLVTLLTFPLCGIAMFALVHRLTGHAAGAFAAGLAFAFSPYRVSQLSHVQMLATFWAPLALLGLHAYLDTRRRRWLALYAVAWLLQVTSNAYYLVHFSVLTALWVTWFVVLRRQWRVLRDITIATLLAGLPLAPLLARYIAVHARHGFSRELFEVEFFSADLAGLFCASEHLRLWGWLRHGCRAEGDLFPGLAVVVVAVIGAARVAGWWPRVAEPRQRVVVVVGRLASATMVLAFVVAAAVAALGPLRTNLGPLRLSASGIEKPVIIGVLAMVLAVALSRRTITGLRQGSTLTFYLGAAVVTWALALGPTMTVAGVQNGRVPMPYDLLMALPGADGVRVPARFWMMSTLSLAVVTGLTLAALPGRRVVAAGLALAVSLGIVADSWTGQMRWGPLPPAPPGASLLRGQAVLALPAGGARDIPPQYDAATGGWRTVNGYSGYEPVYYPALLYAMNQEQADLFVAFRRRFDLHVIAADEAPRLRDLVERQPGAVRVARSAGATLYRLPKQASPPAAEFGQARTIVAVRSDCSQAEAVLAIDGDPMTRWHCILEGDEAGLTADLGAVAGVGALRHVMGRHPGEFPRRLVVETSIDGSIWEAAWDGGAVGEVIEAGLRTPRFPSLVIAFPPRPARFVRLRQAGTGPPFPWGVGELQVGSGGPGPG